ASRARPPWAREPRRLGRREGEEVLERDDAAPRSRGRAPPRAGGPLPRRADGRRRPGWSARDPRPPESRGLAWEDDPLELAPPLRDRADVRPRRRPPQGQGRGRRDGRRADRAARHVRLQALRL